jgi:hypothetical protein
LSRASSERVFLHAVLLFIPPAPPCLARTALNRTVWGVSGTLRFLSLLALVSPSPGPPPPTPRRPGPHGGDGLSLASAYQIGEIGHLVWLGEQAAANKTAGRYYQWRITSPPWRRRPGTTRDTTDTLEGVRPIGTYSSPTPPPSGIFRRKRKENHRIDHQPPDHGVYRAVRLCGHGWRNSELDLGRGSRQRGGAGRSAGGGQQRLAPRLCLQCNGCGPRGICRRTGWRKCSGRPGDQRYEFRLGYGRGESGRDFGIEFRQYDRVLFRDRNHNGKWGLCGGHTGG